MDNYSGVKPFVGWVQKVLPTVYDDALSYQELWGKVIGKLNAVISDNDITIAKVKELSDYLDHIDITDDVEKKLDEMAQSGDLDNIINRVINIDKYNLLADMIQTNTDSITALNNAKRSKNDIGYVDMSKLSQDVREALVGGGQNIPVVGVGAVGTANIANGAVTHAKITKSALPVSIWKGQIVIDRTLHIIKLPAGMIFTAGGTNVICANDITLQYDPTVINYWLTFKNVIENDETTSTAELVQVRDADQYVLGRLDLGKFYFASEADVKYVNEICTDSRASWMCNSYYDRITVDFIAGKVKFNRNRNMLLSIGAQYVLVNLTNSSLDTYQDDLDMPSGYAAGVVVINTQTKKFEIKNALSSLSQDYVAVGFYNKNYHSANFGLLYDIVATEDADHRCHYDIAVFGDSITAGTNTNKTYMQYANEMSGIRLMNYGIGSSGYAFDLTAGSTHLCGNGTMAKGTNQAVSGDNRIAARVTDWINSGYGLKEQAALLFAGTNDFGRGILVDNVAYELRNAINACINSGIPVGVITPIPRVTSDVSGFREYVDTIANTANTMGVPLLNLYQNFFDPNKTGYRTRYFGGDDLHPNNLGHQKLALPIQDFVMRYFSWGTNYS